MPDPEEMIVDPLFPPLVGINDGFNMLVQVNEGEEEAELNNPLPDEAVIDNGPAQINQLMGQMNNEIPHLNLPIANVPPVEIQEDELMDEEDIQLQEQEDQANPHEENQNLVVGRVEINNEQAFDPGLAGWMQKNQVQVLSDSFAQAQACSGPPALWAQFFALVLGIPPTCSVPAPWANFFTAALLTNRMFGLAKEFLNSAPLVSALGDQGTIDFLIPHSCPIQDSVGC